MRVVDFIEDEAVGPRSWKREADLAAVLTGGPYPCFRRGEIPPFEVVNDFLVAGGTGGGMNGGWHWAPFTIDRHEYEELVEVCWPAATSSSSRSAGPRRLRARRGLLARGDFELVDVPAWVATRWEWFAWLMERRHGVDAAENLRLQRIASEWKKAYEQARDSGDDECAADRYLAWVGAEREAANFGFSSRLPAGGGTIRDASDALMDAVARQMAARMRGDEDAARALEPEVEELGRRLRDLEP